MGTSFSYIKFTIYKEYLIKVCFNNSFLFLFLQENKCKMFLNILAKHTMSELPVFQSGTAPALP